jgi:ketosteroid isomerase-like protein
MGHRQAVVVVGALLAAATVCAGSNEDKRAVADLDVKYQAAVKTNDTATIRSILLDDFVLVTGDGSTYSKADIVKDSEARTWSWERQDEEPGTQTVRVWGETAVVTAKLWLKGTSGGKALDKKLWFSDTYVRTPAGWRYAFGQASLGLPSTP